MKKFLVIGSPIKHSLSPQLHNYWIKQNNIDAIYDKKKFRFDEIINAVKENAEIIDISTDDGDLEDIFLELTNN